MKMVLWLLLLCCFLPTCQLNQSLNSEDVTAQLPATTTPAPPIITPTFTPTATQISLESAINQGLFSKQYEFNTPFEQNILYVTPDESWLITEMGAWDLEKRTFLEYTFSTRSHSKSTLGKPWTRTALMENGNIAVINVDSESFIASHSPAQKMTGNILIHILKAEDLRILSELVIPFEFEDCIEEITISPDGSILAVGLLNGKLYLLDLITKEQITSFNANSTMSGMGHRSAFDQILFNYDGSAFATAGADEIIHIWRTHDFSEITSVQGSMRPAFSPDGKYLAYIHIDDRQILVKPLFDEAEPFLLGGHSTRPLNLKFSNDSSLLISVGWQNIKIWSIADKALITELQESDGVTTLSLNSDNSRLYVSYYESGIGVWGLE